MCREARRKGARCTQGTLTGSALGSSQDQIKGQLVKGQKYSVENSVLDLGGQGDLEGGFELRD